MSPVHGTEVPDGALIVFFANCCIIFQFLKFSDFFLNSDSYAFASSVRRLLNTYHSHAVQKKFSFPSISFSRFLRAFLHFRFCFNSISFLACIHFFSALPLCCRHQAALQRAPELAPGSRRPDLVKRAFRECARDAETQAVRSSCLSFVG